MLAWCSDMRFFSGLKRQWRHSDTTGAFWRSPSAAINHAFFFFFFCSYFEAVFRMTFSSCSRPLDAINLRFCSLFTSSRWSGPTPAALNASPLPAATRRSASFPFIPVTDEGGRFFVSVLSGEKAEGKKW